MMEYIALIDRAYQISESEWDKWQEAIKIEKGETVEALALKIQKKLGNPPGTIKILPVYDGKKESEPDLPF